MKKAKRIIALVLVMAFVVAFMAMSASAATTEIQPRATCASCGGWDTVTGSMCSAISRTFVSGCSEYPNLGHYHVRYYDRDFYQCRSCGYTYEYNKYYYTVCE